MSQPSSNDPLKRFLPSEEEIDAALHAALRAEEAAAGPGGANLPTPALQVIRPGALARGKVLAIDADTALLDISYKTEGAVPLAEFGPTPPAIGDEVQALVLGMEDEDGRIPMSLREAQRRQVWEAMAEGAAAGQTDVSGKVVEAVKGGLVLDIGVRAFMPAKELDLRYVEDLEPWVGRDLSVRIIEVDRAKKRVIVSRRALLKEERAKQRDALFETLAEGQLLDGTVTNVTDFGAFVDLGGTEGLVHKGDLAWGHVDKVTEVVNVGDPVRVLVTNFDRSNGRIGLSLKGAGPSPWDDAGTRFAEGTRHTVKIVGLLDFGAIAELDTGVQGLIHVSEMSWSRRVRNPKEIVKIGDEVEVEVLGIDLDKRKISLSMKKVEENPWSGLEQRYPFATIVTGEVTELADFGAFVRLSDGVDGLVHISEFSWSRRFDHASEFLEVGQEVTCIVVGADEGRQRLALSIKKTEPDPWWDVEERYPVGSVHEGEVVRVRAFGAFVALEEGLEGLVHISRLAPHRVDRVQEVVNVGDRVKVEIVSVSEEEQKIGLARVPPADEDLVD